MLVGPCVVFLESDMLTLPLAILIVDSLPFVAVDRLLLRLKAFVVADPKSLPPDNDDGCESLDTEDGRLSIDLMGGVCAAGAVDGAGGDAETRSLEMCESAAEVKTKSLLGLVSMEVLSFSDDDDPPGLQPDVSDLRWPRGGRIGDFSAKLFGVRARFDRCDPLLRSLAA